MDDEDIIRQFAWATDDETPLPVDPTDYQQLKAAIDWTKAEQLRYTRARSDREFERWVEDLEGSHDPFEDDDTIEGFEHYDAVALVAFRNACQRLTTAMEQRDRELLDAWNQGVPIR